MTLSPRATSVVLLLLGTGVAHAVPYELPSSAALPFSQIQPEAGGPTLCATWLDGGACDVPPGTYRLLTYTPGWDGEPARAVTIDASNEGGDLESAPANLRADVYSRRSLELFWDRPAPGVETRYEIRRDGESIAIKDGTSFYETDLVPGRTYRYEVIRAPSDGPRSAIARLAIAPTTNRSPPTITTTDVERLIGVAFDVFAGKGYAAEARALPALPRELGLDAPFVGPEAITDLVLVCDNGGTAVFSNLPSDTVFSGETYVFDDCQLDAVTFEGTLVRDDANSRGGTDLRVRGRELVVDRQTSAFALSGRVRQQEEGFGLGLYTFGFEGEVEYPLGDGLARLSSSGLSLSCGTTPGPDGVFDVTRLDGAFSIRSPETGDETLAVEVIGPFDGNMNADGSGTRDFSRGRLAMNAPDGSRLELDVDNGDPSSYDVTVTNARGAETLTLPLAPVTERVEASFLPGC